MEPEEQVNQFNTEVAEQVQQITQTLTQVEKGLQHEKDLEQEIDRLNHDYRDLSRKRINFITEKEGFTATKPLRPLESTYEGVERDINEIGSNWDILADTFIDHLPEQYDQKIAEKTITA
mgnify:FL=1